jgi:hypothetical protein
MSKYENKMSGEKLVSIELSAKPAQDSDQLKSMAIPPGLDRRTFLMRSAVVGAAAVMTGRPLPAQQQIPIPASEEPKGWREGQVTWSCLPP